MDVLRIDHLSKSFGTKTVIDQLSLVVPERSIFGFVGQNGAGKTTTMKMILGLLPADAGQMTVCGEPVTYGQTSTNRHIGYLPDVPEFYNYMRPLEYLQLCGEITGMPRARIASRSDELLALVGLDGARKQRIGGFSRGMKQRLGIAQALLHEPKLLICDEPTSALDPLGRKDILDILRQVKETTTVLFSTHILSDVERICDHVAFLHRGKIASQGTLAELKTAHLQHGLEITFASADDQRRFVALPFIQTMEARIEQHETSVTIYTDQLETISPLLWRTFADYHLLPDKVERLSTTIERLFMEVNK